MITKVGSADAGVSDDVGIGISDDVGIAGSDVAGISDSDAGGAGRSDANIVIAKSCSEFFTKRLFAAVEYFKLASTKTHSWLRKHTNQEYVIDKGILMKSTLFIN